MTPFLRRRNALWRALRALPPGSAEFEARLGELARLTGWERGRLLAGLGWTELGCSELGCTEGEVGGADLSADQRAGQRAGQGP